MPAVGDEAMVVPDEHVADEDVVVPNGEGAAVLEEVDVSEGAHEAEVGGEEAAATSTMAHEEFTFINICTE